LLRTFVNQRENNRFLQTEFEVDISTEDLSIISTFLENNCRTLGINCAILSESLSKKVPEQSNPLLKKSKFPRTSTGTGVARLAGSSSYLSPEQSICQSKNNEQLANSQNTLFQRGSKPRRILRANYKQRRSPNMNLNSIINASNLPMRKGTGAASANSTDNSQNASSKKK
jgi:hypothetical protein